MPNPHFLLVREGGLCLRSRGFNRQTLFKHPLRTIDDNEWALIFQVVEQQSARGEVEYQTLRRRMFMFEYQDQQGGCFGINPMLAETKRYQAWVESKEGIA